MHYTDGLWFSLPERKFHIFLFLGFITCAQVVGTTISLAIANSMFLNESQKSLLPDVSIQEVEAIFSGTSTLISSLPAAEKVKAESAIVDAMGST